MIAAVDWDAVTLAGAFILGAILATVATIRIMRAVFGVVDVEWHRRRKRDDPEP